MAINEALAEYLALYHKGEVNAVTSRELECSFQMRGSELRREINALRGDGIPICSFEGGYYGGQFKEILDEQTFLKEKRSGILADNNEQTKANQRIKDAAQTLENASPHITEWDESAIRQLVETVKVLSKDEIAVTLKGGIETCQKIMY